MFDYLVLCTQQMNFVCVTHALSADVPSKQVEVQKGREGGRKEE